MSTYEERFKRAYLKNKEKYKKIMETMWNEAGVRSATKKAHWYPTERDMLAEEEED